MAMQLFDYFFSIFPCPNQKFLSGSNKPLTRGWVDVRIATPVKRVIVPGKKSNPCLPEH
jgi:hypothetical protein